MKISIRYILTFVLLFTFSSGLTSCGKKESTENKEKTSEKKEQGKTDSKTTEKKDSTKSINSIVVFTADLGDNEKQIARFGDCKDFQVNSNKDFIDVFLRSETGYEKGTNKILEEMKDIPDQIYFEMKKNKLAVSLLYDWQQDNEKTLTASKFENEGNIFTITFTKDGKESVITGKILYIDMKLRGWKDNKMKVLLVDFGKFNAIYFVGPDWAG